MAEGAEFRTIAQGGSAQITEKKSRFIATVMPVHSEEEAAGFLADIRKTYWDARHNCYAYVIDAQSGRKEAGPNILQKCSDDGEPSGTAGRPILDVLTGENLRDTLLVVTRYFGGTLLGTGGLIRAYTQAARAGLAASRIVTRKPGVRLTITTDYAGLGRLTYILGQHGIPAQEPLYGENVQLTVTLPAGEADRIKAEITEATAGQARMIRQGDCWYDE